jgi:hypothetical protein
MRSSRRYSCVGRVDHMTMSEMIIAATYNAVTSRIEDCAIAWRGVVLALLCALLLCAATSPAFSQAGEAPAPPVKPPPVATPQPPPKSTPKPQPAKASHPVVGAEAQSAAACLAALAASGAKAESVAAPPTPLPDCGIASPIRLNAIALASGSAIDLPDKPIIDCAFARIFADYARDLIAPLGASMLGSPVTAIETGPGYECRGRNRVSGAKTSAHGRGNAIDMTSIALADGRRIAVERQKNATEILFVRSMRIAACGWFVTVLGPGSDAAHANNMHLDIERHGSSDRYRICD